MAKSDEPGYEPAITREQFFVAYAERSQVDPDWLREHRAVVPCRCGDELCEGWQMVPVDLAEDPMVARWGP